MQHVTIDRVQHVLGLTAAGGIATQANKIPDYGHYLTTHGYGLLSYAEWMQVFASIYVIMLIIKLLKVHVVFKKIFNIIFSSRDKIDREFVRKQRENDVLDKNN